MLELRPFSSLGHANHGWLDAHYHFSFSHYVHPERMGWGALRVWNDDIISPKAGFPPHPHANMEIITYVRQGAITHRDNQGNQGTTVAGDVQVMSAGTGIEHAEYNLEDEEARIFQIWIHPDHSSGKPNWGTKKFPKASRSGNFVTLASGLPGDEDALFIRASSRVLATTLSNGQALSFTLGKHRKGYLVVAYGHATVNGITVNERDGLAISDTETLEIQSLDDKTEIILVDTH